MNPARSGAAPALARRVVLVAPGAFPSASIKQCAVIRQALHGHSIGVVVGVGAAIAGSNSIEDVVPVKDPVDVVEASEPRAICRSKAAVIDLGAQHKLANRTQSLAEISQATSGCARPRRRLQVLLE